MVIWIFVSIGAPLTLAVGIVSVFLVLFEKTRWAGRALSAATVVAGAVSTLLSWKAYPRESELVSPDALANEAQFFGRIGVIGMACGLLATTVALRASRRRIVNPPY